MSEEIETTAESSALVPIGRGDVAQREAGALAPSAGTRALAFFIGNPVARRVAFAGVAFGVGFKLSRMLQGGPVPEMASTARDVYRTMTEDDPEAEGRLAGRWVRETITVIAGISAPPDDGRER